MDRKTMTTRLGLPEDATDEAIGAAVVAKPTALAEEPAPAAEPATAKIGDVPKGFVLVDQATLASIKAGADAGLTLAAKSAEADRDKTLDDAIEAGKFAAGSRKTFEELWEVDGEKARSIIASMPAGLIPVTQIARATGGDDRVEDEDGLVASIEAQLFPELRGYEGSVLARAARANTNGGQR